MSTQVAILLFPDVEVLDFAGPYEVFTTASRVAGRLHPADPPPFQVFTVAREPGWFQARAGLPVWPDHGIHAHPSVDLLLIPGGVVTASLEQADLIDWIRVTAATAATTAAVCTGAFLLARAGLLDGQPATTHWEDMADLGRAFPRLQVVAGKRWVETGKLFTSGGISAGIDLSLHLVQRFAGRDLALATARQMDYRWDETASPPGVSSGRLP